MIIRRAAAAASAGTDTPLPNKLRAMIIFFLQLPQRLGVYYIMVKKGIKVDEFAPSLSPRPEDCEAGLLVARVQAGDRLAFRLFIEKYQRLVAAIVFRMVHNAADREELSQEVFLKIFKNIDQFQGGAKVTAWIGRITSNTCINHLRKKRLPLYDDIAPSGPGLENIAGGGSTPEQMNEQANLNLKLQGEIDRLPAHYRLVLTLFHFSEMNYEEIGQALALPVGTVKSHLFRARQKLRERLAPALQEKSWTTDI
jgi:RNA polymerase sigma factor (sigma-70 family)